MSRVSSTTVIAGKDLRNLFLSPLFYILAGVCTLVWSVIFIMQTVEFRQQGIVGMMQGQNPQEGLSLHFTVFFQHFSLVNLFLIFMCAALTMRLFTEEKRNRTFDLLLTSPVTATDITLGKFIAGVVTSWALVTIGFVYPLSLAFFGKLEWGPLVSSYLGMLLLSGVYVAIGIFASSLTSSTVISVMMAIIFNMITWFIGAAASSTTDPTQKAIVEHLNIGVHLQNFLKGSVTIASLVFFLSVIALFTFLTQRVVESSRWR